MVLPIPANYYTWKLLHELDICLFFVCLFVCLLLLSFFPFLFFFEKKLSLWRKKLSLWRKTNLISTLKTIKWDFLYKKFHHIMCVVICGYVTNKFSKNYPKVKTIGTWRYRYNINNKPNNWEKSVNLWTDYEAWWPHVEKIT